MQTLGWATLILLVVMVMVVLWQHQGKAKIKESFDSLPPATSPLSAEILKVYNDAIADVVSMRQTVDQDLYKKAEWADKAKLSDVSTETARFNDVNAQSINLLGHLNMHGGSYGPAPGPGPAPLVSFSTSKLNIKDPNLDTINTYGLAFKDNKMMTDVIVAKKNGRVITSSADIEMDSLKLAGKYTFSDNKGSLNIAGGDGVQLSRSLGVDGDMLASSLSVGGNLEVDSLQASSGAMFDGAIISQDEICIGKICINQDRFKELAAGRFGPPGAMGPQGPQGPEGEQGRTGAQGERGITGGQGPQGPQGVTGDEGPQGEKGVRGIMGVQGDTGLMGPTGPKGLKGETGVRGKKGVDISNIATTGKQLIITYDDGTTANVPFPEVGKVITEITIQQTDLILTYGDNSTQKVPLPIPALPPSVYISGAQGKQGPKGEQGPIGATGATGPNGEAGMSIKDIQPVSRGVLRVTYSNGKTEDVAVNTVLPKYMVDIKTIDNKVIAYYSDNTSDPIVTLPTT